MAAAVSATSGSSAVAGSVASMVGAASLSHGILGSAAIVGGLRLTRCYDHARIEV